MYGTEQYLWGLSCYVLGVCLVLLFLYWYRNLMPWVHLRRTLFLLLAALLLTPVKAYTDMDFLAPAWFVTAFEALTGEEGAYQRGLIPLIITSSLTLIAYIAVMTGTRLNKSGGKTAKAETEKSTERDREEDIL